MIVTAALAWFDEELEDLYRCVSSLPTVADRLVAVDGGYARYPGAKAASPKKQAMFIEQTAREVGLDVVVDVPDRVWVGQVEKRNHLLSRAAKGSDWIVGVDADHVLHGLRDPVRHELAGLKAEDAVDVDFYTPINHDRPMAEAAAGEWHEDLAGQKARIAAFFRALPGLRVERFHWWYSGMRGDRRVWVWGGDNTYPRPAVHVLYAPFFVEHRCMFRQPKHILANRAFCEDRESIVAAIGQEDPVEALVAA